ncbi:hypothetical protein [Actinocrispum wychmicini]|uniref:Uncharacterized protein n=1 Tax=Actinocrispum wychmicini TaxID=1213861 RepID=A0A4R2JIN8_9PSEU|nr:hypothetical protein [Actinocrispum wychmicini]TCO58302.1 hypothetical protein EV192_105367 [Actinocrispum wychmicini]
MTDPALTTTRRFLHGVAELLLAGPQWRATGELALAVVEGGFTTTAAPALRLQGDKLLTEFGQVELNGHTYTDVASVAGIQAGEPAGVYGEGSGVRPDEVITMDSAQRETLLRAFREGDHALREFAPDLVPVLWPEHFDVAITLDRVNYGVSPGDHHLAEPYAYVGPHDTVQDDFFNAPFGAARPLARLGDANAITQFFRTGQDLLSRSDLRPA